MESKRIAPELLLLILEHVTSPMIQAKLCLLDTQTYALIAPILYNVCDMSKVESVSAFCKAIKVNHSLGRHVTVLLIHCEPPPSPQWNGEDMLKLMGALYLNSSPTESVPDEPQWTEEHVSDLRDALSLLPNLAQWSILYGTGLASLFDDLEVPFQLQALAITQCPGAGFTRFLKAQNSIRFLTLRSFGCGMGETSESDYDSDWGWDGRYYDINRVRAPDPIIEAAADPTFLPDLCILITEPLKCTALAPGRPINRIHVIQNPNAPPLRDGRYKQLAAALGKTSVPLVLLEFMSRYTKPWEIASWDFLSLLCKTRVPERLRTLVLHDNESNLLNQGVAYLSLPEVAQLLGEKFKVLEEFRVPLRASFGGLPPQQSSSDHIRRFLGQIGKLSVWQEFCPTLKSVMLYNQELE